MVMVMNHRLTSLLFHVNQHTPQPFLKWGCFKLWPWNYKVKVMCVVKEQHHTLFWVWCFLFVSHQSDNNSWDTAILKFDLEKSKVNFKGEVKGQGHIVHPASNRCTSCLFHINRTNHSWDMSNSVWPWKNTSEIFKENLAKKKPFWQNSSKI